MSPTEETDEDEHGRGSYDILRAAAANELDCEGVRDLMSSCRLTIDLEVADAAGRTALYWAIAHGQTEVAVLLIEKGARYDEEDQHGRTPLHNAAQAGDEDVVRALLDAGADPSARDHDLRTPTSTTVDETIRALLLAAQRGDQSDVATTSDDDEHSSSEEEDSDDAGVEDLAVSHDDVDRFAAHWQRFLAEEEERAVMPAAQAMALFNAWLRGRVTPDSDDNVSDAESGSSEIEPE